MYVVTIFDLYNKTMKETTFWNKTTAVDFFLEACAKLCYTVNVERDRMEAGGDGYDFKLTIETI